MEGEWIGICVPSITPITFGNPLLFSNPYITAANLASHGHVILLHSKSNKASKNLSVKLLTNPWFISKVCSNVLIPDLFTKCYNTIAICFHTGIAL